MASESPRAVPRSISVGGLAAAAALLASVSTPLAATAAAALPDEVYSHAAMASASALESSSMMLNSVVDVASSLQMFYTGIMVVGVGYTQRVAGRQDFKRDMAKKIASGEMTAEELVAEIQIMAEEINQSANTALNAQYEVQKLLEETKAIAFNLNESPQYQPVEELQSQPVEELQQFVYDYDDATVDAGLEEVERTSFSLTTNAVENTPWTQYEPTNEIETEETEYSEPSYEAETEEGEYSEPSYEAETEEGEYSEPSYEAETEEGEYSEPSYEAETEEGEYSEPSYEAETEEGEYSEVSYEGEYSEISYEGETEEPESSDGSTNIIGMKDVVDLIEYDTAAIADAFSFDSDEEVEQTDFALTVDHAEANTPMPSYETEMEECDVDEVEECESSDGATYGMESVVDLIEYDAAAIADALLDPLPPSPPLADPTPVSRVEEDVLNALKLAEEAFLSFSSEAEEATFIPPAPPIAPPPLELVMEGIEVEVEAKKPRPPEIKIQTVTKAAPAKSVRASPLARILAIELGVRIEEVAGTGMKGRVVADDVRAYAGTVV